MRLAEWEGFAPAATAVAALALLVVLPQEPTATLDNPAVHEAGQFALELEETGSKIGWDDSDSGLSGLVMPLKVFRSTDGTWCRHYIITVQNDATPTMVSRTACRQADGNWRAAAGPPAQVATLGQ